ncbi:3-isopropylmalate dehydratase small subunit [Allopusillimonas ginsengisoli]|uniref:3-isopropylmalate dehydratase small subunit n=1 Tax=Allopusillimonas ginsengisoli TaxID=453575 RepID=UPI0010204E83|nr:3-isopropylmalate dehydratase small subunit [Allopusillimonas ginsengisoli]TEA78812.1 3-isopropylmalate dehydratase small subunit [Allopusillimonas ginsengisoli]
MQPFTQLTGTAAPLAGRNIDTDQIIPGRFLKTDRSTGYKRILFHDLRFDADGRERPDFVLNLPAFREATLLITDVNFGCGSSREAAVYALADYGFRAIIGPSFGDIFYNNCLKNGILPIRLSESTVAGVRAHILAGKGNQVTVDLQEQTVVLPDGDTATFSIDAFWRDCLLKGVDEIELTLSYRDRIDSFEEAYFRARPWARIQHDAHQKMKDCG